MVMVINPGIFQALVNENKAPAFLVEGRAKYDFEQNSFSIHHHPIKNIAGRFPSSNGFFRHSAMVLVCTN